MATNKFEQAISLIYESVASPAHWLQAMRSVADIVEAPRATKFSFDLQNARVWDVSGLGHEEATIEKYEAYFSRLDPGFPVGASAAVGVWHGDEEMLDPRAESQQEFIRDFAYPNGMGRVGGAKLAASGNAAVYFSVVRDVGAKRFEDKGRAQFCRLLPHLVRAEALKEHIGSLTNTALIAQIALDQFSAAAFAVDEDRNLRWSNRSAETLFAAARHLQVKGNKVETRSNALFRRFADAVKHALPPIRQADAFTADAASGASALQILVLPLAEDHCLTVQHFGKMALVIAATLANHLTPRICGQLFRLTDTEAALVHSLANGTRLSAWATGRGIAISTARTHLASVLGKTGCSTQGDLMRLTFTLPGTRNS